ncbi:MAG: HEPN domain-containing protein [Paracoccaceae bacterium]|nr:HEPN domain-containing protein [Paracoccaceae bacterium]MDE2911457.1 HEPN domain-containing protein [Paracoccaceae bacterium]
MSSREQYFRRLKDKHRVLRNDSPETLNLRVHRALSWLQRAEQETDDDDAAFIFYWISFNAAYASEVSNPAGSNRRPRERTSFAEFFAMLVELDREERIYDVIWEQFPDYVRSLLNNRYVFQPFWNHQNGIPGSDDWESRFHRSRRRVARALKEKDTIVILEILFDRLYVLRNQLIHGGSTWKSSVNRDQVRGGRNILARLTQIFFELMMDNPDLPWTGGHYPVVDDT